LLTLSLSCPGAAAAAATPAPAKAEKAADAGAQPAADSGTPGPTVEPTRDSAALAKSCATLGSGDLSALDSLEKEKRQGLVGTPQALHALTCLAVAANDKRPCEALEDEGKKRCLDQLSTFGDLKDLPKEGVKAALLHRMCLAGSSKADCDKIRDAMTKKDAAGCASLGAAEMREFCSALVSGDASKCKGLPEGEERGRCEAYATDDPSRCAKDSVDCRNMAGAFAKVKKDGLAGLGDIDPGAVAATKGKDACAPLLAALATACAQ
jgi:hypothetical protein